MSKVRGACPACGRMADTDVGSAHGLSSWPHVCRGCAILYIPLSPVGRFLTRDEMALVKRVDANNNFVGRDMVRKMAQLICPND